MKIKKIGGYKEINGKKMFLVCWEDQKWSWEEYKNINCVSLIVNFYTSLSSTFSHIEHRRKELAEKNKERDIISQLQNDRRSFSTAETSGFINNSSYDEFNKIIDKRMDNRFQRENMYSDNKNLYSGYSDRRYFESEAAKKIKFSQLEGKSIEIQKPIDLKKRMQAKAAQDLNFKEIKVFISETIQVKGLIKPVTEVFDAEFSSFSLSTIKNIMFFEVLLFSLKQKSIEPFFNLYEFQMTEPVEAFGEIYRNSIDKKQILIDNSNSKYLLFLIFEFESLGKYDINNKYNLVQIKKSNFIEEMENNSELIEVGLDEFSWKKDTLNYFTFIENNFLFNIHKIIKEKIFNFSCYSDSKNRLFKEFKNSLVLLGGKEVSLTLNNSQNIFIDKKWLNYISAIPFFFEKLEKGVDFYVVKFDIINSKYNIAINKILCGGGIITLTKKMLLSPASSGLLEIFEILRRSDSKWSLKIPTCYCEEFERMTTHVKNTLQYAGMLEILRQLQNSIEEVGTNDPTEYLKLIKSKYYNDKRFFLLVDDANFLNESFTPERALVIVKKNL